MCTLCSISPFAIVLHGRRAQVYDHNWTEGVDIYWICQNEQRLSQKCPGMGLLMKTMLDTILFAKVWLFFPQLQIYSDFVVFSQDLKRSFTFYFKVLHSYRRNEAGLQQKYWMSLHHRIFTWYKLFWLHRKLDRACYVLTVPYNKDHGTLFTKALLVGVGCWLVDSGLKRVCEIERAFLFLFSLWRCQKVFLQFHHAYSSSLVSSSSWALSFFSIPRMYSTSYVSGTMSR